MTPTCLAPQRGGDERPNAEGYAGVSMLRKIQPRMQGYILVADFTNAYVTRPWMKVRKISQVEEDAVGLDITARVEYEAYRVH